MAQVSFEAMKAFVQSSWQAAGGSAEDAGNMAEIFTEMTKRGMGHHDIHNYPSRLDRVLGGLINPRPNLTMISAFGGMESWDGDHGTGEVLNHFIMQRAVELAQEHGIGMVTVRNSNHYLCSAPYVLQAAEQGCVGFVMAKAGRSMGMPGIDHNVIGQAPIGYAFPVGGANPVMLDICLAYIAGEPLMMRAQQGVPVPEHWGADRDGNPTTDAAELMRGVKYPIGEHKGFGLALLEELLTGVFSMGAILDEGEADLMHYTGTTHTAIAIRTDGLMPKEVYEQRSRELVDRLRAQSEKIHVPGDSSFSNMEKFNAAGTIELEDKFVEKMNQYAEKLGIAPLV